MKRSSLPILIILLLISNGRTAGQTRSSDEIERFVQERMDRLNIPGAALAIVQGDEVVHLEGYGVADASGRAMTPQTPVLLASLSKSMTAVAVMQLVEAGQVELDAPIQLYLPWFMPDTPITVRQLLHQTSGLDEAHGYRRNLEADGPNALEASIRLLATTRLNRPPGSVFEYSNSNYDVLGLLVAAVSERPYGEYIRTNLFEPLEMGHAHITLEEGRADGMASAFYPFFGRPTSMDGNLPFSRATQPSAGLIASAADLTHYLIAHLNNGRYGPAQILSRAGMETLHTPGITLNDTGLGYAMGWAVWPFDDAAEPGASAPVALSHGGKWLGANHIMLMIPEQDFGLVWLVNTNDPGSASAYPNVAFDVALLALGLEAQNYPPAEDWLSQNLRSVSVALVVALLSAGWFAVQRLRRDHFSRRDSWLFGGLAIVDVTLIAYLLFFRLPGNDSSVRQVLRFEPDLGIMLLLILLLTAGWGSLRSLWALRCWRSGLQHRSLNNQ